jgi:hypothetical protein
MADANLKVEPIRICVDTINQTTWTPIFYINKKLIIF